MGHALIWVEWLAAVVLLLAWVTACAARWSSPWGRVGLPVVVALAFAGLAGAFSFVLLAAVREGVMNRATLAYFSSWGVALAFAAVIVLISGFRRQGEAGPAARSWSRGGLAVAAGVAVVLGCITFSNMDLAMKLRLSVLRAEAGAKALALAPSRLADSDNAALYYLEAFARFPLKGDPAALSEQANRWLAERDFPTKEVTEFLRTNEYSLAILGRASTRPGCAFERESYANPLALLPELAKLRFAVLLLDLDARAQARQGNIKAALQDVATIFLIARHTGEPLLLSMVTSAEFERIGGAALQDVMARAGPRQQEVADFFLPNASYHRMYRRGLQMEEFGYALPFLLDLAESEGWQEWMANDLSPGLQRIVSSPFYRVFFLADDLAAYRAWMREYHELAALPYAEAREGWAVVLQEIRRHGRGGILTGLFLPAAEKSAIAAARADANRSLAWLAIKVYVFRAKQGKFPDQLDQLVPDYLTHVLIDPFTGQPLRDRRDGKDLVLYSVGPGKQKSDEITFRLRGD